MVSRGARTWLASILVLLLTFALFARTLSFGLYYDDNHHARPWELAEVLGTFCGPFDPLGIEPPYFRPLLVVSFALDWALWGWEPWGYHLTNVTLHALAAILVLRVLLASGAPLGAALFGSAYFALIPANVATAVYISERSDAMVAIFTLCALLAMHAWVESARRGWLLLTFGCVALALCSKEIGASAATLTLLFWLYLSLQREGSLTARQRVGLEEVRRYPAELQAALLAWWSDRAWRARFVKLVAPLLTLLAIYAVYRTLVLPTGLISAKYGDVGPLRGYVSALLWTFKAVPWEIPAPFILPLVGVSLLLAVLARPSSRALGLILLGSAMVAVSAAPLGLLGQVEPRLLYLPEVGHAVTLAGVATAATAASGVLRISLSCSLLALTVALGVAHFRAQNEFAPDSYKMLKGYRLVVEDPLKDRYPRRRLDEIEEILKSARERGLDGAR